MESKSVNVLKTSIEFRFMKKIATFYKSLNHDFNLIKGDCKSILELFDFKFDLIFADPPYFLTKVSHPQ